MPGVTVDEFKSRRNALFKLLGSDQCAVLKAAPVKYASQNIFYRYQQDNNFLYMTGWNEPDTVAVLERDKFTLFFNNQDEHERLWQGSANGAVVAKELFKADYVYPLGDLDEYLLGRKQVEESQLEGLIHKLRVLKSPAEIDLMHRAATIAESAMTEVQKALVEGIRDESQVEALFDFSCRRRGAQSLAYVPVVAGDDRGCTIHYTRNDRPFHSGLLLDAGCRFHGYCSDVTRTFDLSNRATMQRVIDVVRNVQSDCIDVLRKFRPSLDDLNVFAMHQLAKYLQRDLNIVARDQLLHQLFPHSIGHYLGMDVHDCPTVETSMPIQPGMVITIEPGLYFPHDFDTYGGMSCRIEDDCVITADGVQVISKCN